MRHRTWRLGQSRRNPREETWDKRSRAAARQPARNGLQRLRLLVIRLFPVPSVERCAGAQADYIAAYENLRERLAQLEATPPAAD